MDKRTTPDKLADLKDAGCCTGMDVRDRTQPSEAALARGFSKVSGESDVSEILAYVDPTQRGFLTRPGGWER